MSQTIRELLVELAWVEDSLRHIPLDEPADSGRINVDVIALAEREQEIIAELRKGSPAAS